MSDLSFVHCNMIAEAIEKDHLFMVHRDNENEEQSGIFRCVEQSSGWTYLVVFPGVEEGAERTRFKSSGMLTIFTLRYIKAGPDSLSSSSLITFINHFNSWSHAKAVWHCDLDHIWETGLLFSLSIYLGNGEPIASLSTFILELSQLINEHLAECEEMYQEDVDDDERGAFRVERDLVKPDDLETIKLEKDLNFIKQHSLNMQKEESI